MRIWQWALIWFFLITASIWATVLFSLALYPLFIGWFDLDSMSNLSFGRLYANYVHLLGYLQAPWPMTLTFPDFAASASGLHHFAEVKTLMLVNNGVCLLTAWPALHSYRQLQKTHTRWWLVRPLMIGGVVPVGLIGLMALNFDAVFVRFHEVLFRNDDWLFDPSRDPIINVLPEAFFAACFVIALALFEGAVLSGIRVGKKDARETPAH